MKAICISLCICLHGCATYAVKPLLERDKDEQPINITFISIPW